MPTLFESFLKDPGVASIAPTSRFGIRKICKLIDFEKAMVIVEYGPGTGVISKPILERMRPDAKLILIETNPELVQMLKETMQDPRVIVVQGSAENVRNILTQQGSEAADYVISGIPFSYFSEKLRSAIVEQTYRSLRAGGHMIVYQFRRPVAKEMKKVFGALETGFVLLNFPSLWIFHAERRSR